MAQQQETENKFNLFTVAVFMMAAVSCYTTAMGVEPMLGNMVLSWVVAAALSIFMVAIALKFPEAYKEGRHKQMIWGYSAVAIFSVLLNFNAIYGTFTGEKLLYGELTDKRNDIEELANRGISMLNKEVGLDEAVKDLEAAKVAYENEVNNPSRIGHGRIAQRLYQEMTDAKAKVNAASSQIEVDVSKIERIKNAAFREVDTVLTYKDISKLQAAVDPLINKYNEIANLLNAKLGENEISTKNMTFIHRDAGNLNHSLWTITQIFKLGGRQATAIIVSLLLSILIDFIVLFVLVLTNIGGGSNYGNKYRRQIRKRKTGPIQFRTKDSSSGSTGIIQDRD